MGGLGTWLVALAPAYGKGHESSFRSLGFVRLRSRVSTPRWRTRQFALRRRGPRSGLGVRARGLAGVAAAGETFPRRPIAA